MRPEDIDQIFRESANSAHFDFEPQEWQKANALLPKKKRRRWLPLILLSLGLGSITALALFQSQQNVRTDNLQKTSTPIVLKENPLQISTSNDALLKQYSINESQDLNIKSRNFRTSQQSKIGQGKTAQSLSTNTKEPTITNARQLGESETINITAFIPQIDPINPSIKWDRSITSPKTYNEKETSFYKKWDLGFSISATFQNLEGGSNGTGASAGFIIQRNLQSGLYIELAPQLSWTTGFEHITQRQTEKIYGLESHDINYGMQLRQLIQLELPLRLGINFEKWRFGLGPNLSYLMEGSGDIVELSSPDDDFAILKTLSKGRFYSGRTSNHYFGISGNLNYRLSRLAEVGIDVRRTSHQFFTSDFNPLFNKGGWLINLTYNLYLD